MIKSFDFYFDFVSPYSYLAHKQIRKLEVKESIKINYKPIFLGGLLKLTGIKANVNIPNKAKFMIRDCKLWAEKYSTIFKFNNYFPINSLSMMRGTLIAEKNNYFDLFIDRMFDAFWKEGLNLNDQTIYEKILKNLNINPKNFITQSSDVKIKNDLINRTNEAYKLGLFGAPSFIVNNKMFWGQDRLEFVIKEAKIKF